MSLNAPTVASSPATAALPPAPRYQEVADFERLPPSAEPLEAAPPTVALVNASPRQTWHRVVEAAHGRIDAAAFEELLFAVSEAVLNAHLYGRRPITVRVWTSPERIVVRVHDTGPGPADPLTGLVPAPRGSAGCGLGLWLIHQFTNIDVALLAADGFTVRLRAGGVPAPASEGTARTGTPRPDTVTSGIIITALDRTVGVPSGNGRNVPSRVLGDEALQPDAEER
jgi:hypothetical protein